MLLVPWLQPALRLREESVTKRSSISTWDGEFGEPSSLPDLLPPEVDLHSEKDSAPLNIWRAEQWLDALVREDFLETAREQGQRIVCRAESLLPPPHSPTQADVEMNSQMEMGDYPAQGEGNEQEGESSTTQGDLPLRGMEISFHRSASKKVETIEFVD